MSEHVQSTIENHILTIRLCRPQKKNAFTEAMYGAGRDAFIEAANNTDIHAVLFCADGDFSAGNDLQDFLANPPKGESATVFQFMLAMRRCPVPIVAAVSGFAVGIGTTLLLHCDFAYAADNTVFSLPFVKLALLPEFASSMLLPQRAGHLKAAELILLGDNFDAPTAISAGLITAMCLPEALDNTAAATCKRLAKTPRDVLIQTKALLRRDPESVEDRITYESQEFLKALGSDNAKAAFTAILTK